MTSLLQNRSIDDAKSLLKKVVGNDKNRKKMVKYLLSQGLTEDEIATYLANPQSLTESQRSDIGRKLAQKKQLETGLDYLKKGAQVAATGYGGYQLYQMGSSLARSILGRGAQNNIAGSILGRNTSRNIINPVGGQPGIQPPPFPGMQPSTNAITPEIQRNIAKNVVITGAGLKPQQIGQTLRGIVEENNLQQQAQLENQPPIEARITKAPKLLEQRQTLRGVVEKPEAEQQQAELENQPPIEAKVTKLPRRLETPPEKKQLEYKKNLHADVNSSVIRKMEYNKKNHTLKVIFNNGSTYEYYDFPEDKFRNIAQGQATAKTKGENNFGIWWVGKNPSAGAAFNEIIKPSLRRNGPYKYARVANTTFSPEEVEEMRHYQARALPMR